VENQNTSSTDGINSSSKVNNNNISNSKSEKTESDGDDEEEEAKEDTRKSLPVDWKPQDKCYFCVDGKLLTVNEEGELVTEQGPANAEAELTNSFNAFLSAGSRKCGKSVNLDSDSESSESAEREVQTQPGGLAAQQSVAALLRAGGVPPNMTSLETMAAHIAAISSLQQNLQQVPGLYPFNRECPLYIFVNRKITSLFFFLSALWYSQLAMSPSPSSPVDRLATSSPSGNKSASDVPTPPETTGNGDQPLDLSKPSTSGIYK
jgi:hypothetical protein